jgi:hypothetical protein
VELNEGRKDDINKDRWDLLVIEVIQDLVKVLTHGAVKYQPENWKKVPNAVERYFAALMRHLAAWRMGEVYDKDSGLPHLAHVMCCVMFISWFDKQKQIQIPSQILKVAEKVRQLQSLKVVPLKMDSKTHKVVEKLPSDNVKGVVNLAAGGVGCSCGKKVSHSHDIIDKRPRKGTSFLAICNFAGKCPRRAFSHKRQVCTDKHICEFKKRSKIKNPSK